MFVDDHRELVNARRAGDVSQDGVHLFGSLHQRVELLGKMYIQVLYTKT